MGIEQHTDDNLFWEIATSYIADNEWLRQAVGKILSAPNDEAVTQDCFTGIEEFLTWQFGLPPELSGKAIQLCSEGLVAEDGI